MLPPIYTRGPMDDEGKRIRAMMQGPANQAAQGGYMGGLGMAQGNAPHVAEQEKVAGYSAAASEGARQAGKQQLDADAARMKNAWGTGLNMLAGSFDQMKNMGQQAPQVGLPEYKPRPIPQLNKFRR